LSPYRVGLTGGLAAGKSTVAGWLGEAGFRVIDADRLVAEFYRPGGQGTVAVTELFGAEFLTTDGSVDHPRLAREVFAEPAARRRLEEAIHPLVKQRFDQLTQGGSGVAVLEATLLVEAGFAPDFDLVVTVEADPELRLQRAVARGLEPAAARRRLEAQSEPALRIAAAHRVLWNNGSLDELRGEVDKLIAELRGHDGDD
jgi:dephospho-CoA kinase